MPRKPEGLQRRGSIWWLRVRVPDDLRDAVGKREIRRSLKTSDYEEARSRVRFERSRVDADFARRRRALPPKATKQPTEQDLWFAAARLFVDLEQKATQRNLEGFDLKEALLEWSTVRDPETFYSSFQHYTHQALKAAHIELTAGDKSWPVISRYVHQALVEVERRVIVRAAPEQLLPANALFADLNERSVIPTGATMTLDSLIDRYEADPGKRPGAVKSRLKRDSELRLIREFFGRRTRLTDITRARCRSFLELLSKYPSNANKRFGEVSLTDAIALAEEKGLAPMSATTANAYLATFNRLMEFALHEQWIKDNPAKKLRIQGKRSYTKNGRDPFTIDELNRIFRTPLYAGCKDDWQGYAIPGDAKPRRGRFWVPLLCLFHGMRLNEACQLTCDDVVAMDGVDVILIRGTDDETKRVKTEAGQRFVPVHPQVVQIGFLAFVQKQRANGRTSRLFPELGASNATGYLSDPFSKWFARFLGKAGIHERRKTFHSFRHSYRDALREADISIERVRALGGWSGGNTEERYGSGLKASTLAREIGRVQYSGLDLSHLRQGGGQ